MPNQEAIIENIRKLESMGLHGEELIAQLNQLGIPRTQAERWIKEAHPAQNTATVTTNQTFRARETPNTLNPVISSTTYVPPAPQAPMATEKLWEKGILATVDAKLSQMERMKKEIDDVLETRVQAHYDSMEKKLEALFDAQRELYKFKMDGQLNAKTKEVEDILDQKIEEIKTLNVSTQENLQRIKGQKMVIEDLAKDLSDKSLALDATKKAIIDDTGQKLEELQEKVDELITGTETRMREVENRATKTLELEEKITSNLSVQMEEQANKIVEEKVEDLRMEIKKEIIELKKLGADLASKDIQGVVEEFKEMNEKMEKTKKGIDALVEQKTREVDQMLEKKLLDVDKIVNTKMETIVKEKEQTFTRKVDTQSMDVNSLKKELAQKLLETETRMQGLDGFQKQFLETLKRNNMEREELVNILKKKIETFDARADEKVAIIDQRLKQLDAVVGELSGLLMQWKGQQAQNTANASAAATHAAENTAPPKKTGFNPFKK
jgi:hypothetical protein